MWITTHQKHAKTFAQGGSYFDEPPSDLVFESPALPSLTTLAVGTVHSISILVVQAFATGLTVCTRGGEKELVMSSKCQPTEAVCKKASQKCEENSAVGSENDTGEHWRPKDAL